MVRLNGDESYDRIRKKTRLNQTNRGPEIGKERSHHRTRNIPEIFVPVSRGSQPSFEAPQMAPVNMETLATVISNWNWKLTQLVVSTHLRNISGKHWKILDTTTDFSIQHLPGFSSLRCFQNISEAGPSVKYTRWKAPTWQNFVIFFWMKRSSDLQHLGIIESPGR